jgi:hypothetical protein
MSEEEKSEKPVNREATKINREKTDKPLSSKNTPTIEDPTLEVKDWASYLSAETRDPSWIDNGYVMPDEVSALCSKLTSRRGTLQALIGYQGTGKTSAMLAIDSHLRKSQPEEQKPKSNISDTILIKWRRPSELIADFLGRDDAFATFVKEIYRSFLARSFRKTKLEPGGNSRSCRRELHRFDKAVDDMFSLNFSAVERELGKRSIEGLRYESFLEVLRRASVILIDLPDYSKTDMRRVSSDLEAIYWIWDNLARRPKPPNIVISFQKEMFRGHYFLGKMNRIDLKPLKPEKLVEAYRKCFRDSKVFAEDALLLLAKMSHGVFRRFLKYMTLSLDYQERTNTSLPITPDQVREAISPQLLAEDMDQQLTEIFPRQPELRTQAVKLLLYLEEHGPTSQTKIAEELSIPNYTVSRLLSRLEDHHYIRREKEGVENIVFLETP